jgi:hypothetical protein
MTLDDFINKFENHKRFEKIYYKILCFAAIVGALFLVYSVFVYGKSKGLLFLAVFLFVLGSYGLFALTKHYKLTTIKNNNSEQDNIEVVLSVIKQLTKKGYTQEDNYFYFMYQKSWWRLKYEVYVLATTNAIIINAEGKDSYDGGFIDFGASRRTQKNIAKLLADKSSL